MNDSFITNEKINTQMKYIHQVPVIEYLYSYLTIWGFEP